MNVVGARHLGAFLVAGLVFAAGCSDCGEGDEAAVGHVAELTAAAGDVQRDHAARRDQWEKAGKGLRFQPGDGLKTGAGASARVALTHGGALRMGEKSFVRFLTKAPEAAAPSLQVDLGDVEVQSGAAEVEVQTPVSRLQVQKASAVAIEFERDDHARFEVTVGKARYITRDDETHDLEKGQQVLVNLKSGRVERRDRAAKKQPPAVSEPDAGSDAGEEGLVQIRVIGDEAQSRGPDDSRWQNLAAGAAEVPNGTRLRIGKGTSVEWAHGEARATLVGSAEAAVAGGSSIRVSRGRVNAKTGGVTLTVAVPGGAIVLRPHARSTVKVGRDEAEVSAQRGRVEVRGGEEPVVLNPGGSATLARNGEVDQDGVPTRAVFAFVAGSSPLVHDPVTPTNVAVRFGEICGGEGLVDLSDPGGDGPQVAAQGRGVAIVRLPPGGHRYRLYCVEGGVTQETAVKTGTIRILNDAGTGAFGVAGHNRVDSDGRSYTIQYQGAPPRITFRWSGAPAADGYTFHISGGGGRTVKKQTSRPSYTVSSSRFRQGNYSYYFTTSTGHRSPRSRLKMSPEGRGGGGAFASIREPANGAIRPGATARVSGLARPGSTIKVGGTALTLDGNRFSGEVVAPTDVDALAIRVSHPEGGTHIFLRRLATGSE